MSDELWGYICEEIISIKRLRLNRKTIYVTSTGGLEYISAIGIYGNRICVISRIKLVGIFGYPTVIVRKSELDSFLSMFKHVNVTNIERTNMLKEFAKNYISSIIYIPFNDC